MLSALSRLALPLVFLAGLGLAGGAAVLAGSGRADLTAADQARVAKVTRPATRFAEAERFERMSAGAATTTRTIDTNIFSHASANLPFEGEQEFKVGNGLFKKVWVSSPSSTQASDGLGPLYNQRSCQRCHLKDGRGRPPLATGEPTGGLLLRLSVPPRTAEERAALAAKDTLRIPEPTYGGQLQTLAVPGLAAEGHITVDHETHEVTLAGGETVTLTRPVYGITDLGFGPMDPETMVSPRLANPMIGLGLLEAIEPADILANADPDDADGDGVSGRPSMVRDPETGELVLGRFGWKATTPSIRVQSAEAFGGDIGISTPLVTDAFGECSLAQSICRDMPSGVQPQLGDVEAPDPVLPLVTFYAQNLAVPARRDVDDPAVLAGKALFYGAGCASCHVPKYVTSRDAAQPELRFQLIWPYTDLLLHDMGEGLADGRPVGDATGTEWRTPPLWGIGLTEVVNGNTFYLHDGRARTLLEAILWHGGEARAARDAVAAMTPDERAALLAFLNSL
ncbi:di-heme oxidoredictase family protein [Acuticoccus sp. I52.16.1]|uniref:di-heme oxidoreductase family protein n=1 Tax=Acuticoccus sp. I52.16.1 TaxID=2928472 RepID=UPI001FD3DC90|nr:di-heme oxidoredictase family protein [Acuticoccus sp. I52.16.1]UOM32933.1 c-type cytochrome [Acuticoccus sp. I52.16.1]